MAFTDEALDALNLRLMRGQIAACTCGTKPPEYAYHALSCKYRMLAEAQAAIQYLRAHHTNFIARCWHALRG